MNKNQVIGITRIIVPVALAWVAGRGYIPEESILDITTLIVTAVSIVWSYLHFKEKENENGNSREETDDSST